MNIHDQLKLAKLNTAIAKTKEAIAQAVVDSHLAQESTFDITNITKIELGIKTNKQTLAVLNKLKKQFQSITHEENTSNVPDDGVNSHN